MSDVRLIFLSFNKMADIIIDSPVLNTRFATGADFGLYAVSSAGDYKPGRYLPYTGHAVIFPAAQNHRESPPLD